jgi:hypothetical protein
MKTLFILAIIVLAVVIFFMFQRCKLDCHLKEGLSHRVPSVYNLKDNAYSKYPLPSWHVNWPYTFDTKENYTHMYKCNKMCSHIPGNTPNANCMAQCMDMAKMTYTGAVSRPCVTDDDCLSRELCVTPAPYTSGDLGMCLSDNEPGIPRNFYH